MSIEQQLDALTIAINNLTGAILGARPSTGGAPSTTASGGGSSSRAGETAYVHVGADGAVTVTETPAPEKPKAEKAAKKTEPATKETAATAQPADTPDTPAPTAATGTGKELTYDTDVKPKFLALFNAKGQAVARSVIDHFDKSKTRLSEAVTTQAQLAEAIELIEKLAKAD